MTWLWQCEGVNVIFSCFGRCFRVTRQVGLNWDLLYVQIRGPGMINRDYYLKKHNTLEYLEYSLILILMESMVRRVLKKINTKLNLLLRQSNYWNYSSRRLLYNALIQAHFDYGCTSRLPWKLNCKLLKTSTYVFVSDSHLVVIQARYISGK